MTSSSTQPKLPKVFTPGPWTFEVHELSEGFSGIVYDSHGQRVGTDHLSEADAALIAAAPELYEALKKSAEGWANALELGLIPEQHRTSATILRDEARDALAKVQS